MKKLQLKKDTIGQSISNYEILEKLPSTMLRTSPSTEFILTKEGLGTGGGGGNLSRTSYAWETKR